MLFFLLDVRISFHSGEMHKSVNTSMVYLLFFRKSTATGLITVNGFGTVKYINSFSYTDKNSFLGVVFM